MAIGWGNPFTDIPKALAPQPVKDNLRLMGRLFGFDPSGQFTGWNNLESNLKSDAAESGAATSQSQADAYRSRGLESLAALLEGRGPSETFGGKTGALSKPKDPTGQSSKVLDTLAGAGGAGLQAGANALDILLSALTEVQNKGTREQVADLLAKNLGPGSNLSNEVRGVASGAADALAANPIERFKQQMEVLNRTRGESQITPQVTDSLSNLFGYSALNPESMRTDTRDPRNAVGRFNVSMDRFEEALSTNRGNRDSTLAALADDTASSIQDTMASEQAAYDDAMSQLDSSIGQVYGKDSPVYQKAVQRLKTQRSQQVGNMRARLTTSYSNLKAQYKANYDAMANQLVSSREAAAATYGAQTLQEQGAVQGALQDAFRYDAENRKMFSEMETRIVDMFHNETNQAILQSAALKNAAIQFDMMGLQDVARALLGTQFNPEAITGWGDAMQPVSQFLVDWANRPQQQQSQTDPYGAAASVGSTIGNIALPFALKGS